MRDKAVKKSTSRLVLVTCKEVESNRLFKILNWFTYTTHAFEKKKLQLYQRRG